MRQHKPAKVNVHSKRPRTYAVAAALLGRAAVAAALLAAVAAAAAAETAKGKPMSSHSQKAGKLTPGRRSCWDTGTRTPHQYNSSTALTLAGCANRPEPRYTQETEDASHSNCSPAAAALAVGAVTRDVAGLAALVLQHMIRILLVVQMC